MRLIVDPEICQGHLRCHTIAPDLFDVDDIGHAISPDREISDGPEMERALAAVAACPERAISFAP